jgi:hypothetical protein
MKHTLRLALAIGLCAFASVGATPRPSISMAFDWDEISALRGGLELEMADRLQRISECTQRGDKSCAEAWVYDYTRIDRLRIRLNGASKLALNAQFKAEQ